MGVGWFYEFFGHDFNLNLVIKIHFLCDKNVKREKKTILEGLKTQVDRSTMLSIYNNKIKYIGKMIEEVIS